ncbi:MAG TPA: c-type cytochrome [Gammaproteobacteria bacterium]|nr:c-type cytochrome [Gammaproteobacteria bacterium]
MAKKAQSKPETIEEKHDRHFYDSFMLVLGILVAFAFCMYWLANGIADANPGAAGHDAIAEQQLVDQRLAPIADAQISGDAKSQMAAPAAAASTAAGSSGKSGKEIWQGTCSACHQSGLLGAPKIGDKAAWAPRIAKGMATLKQHALHGFNQMPAHGGNPALSDDDVVKALEYMVGQSGGPAAK